MKAPVMPQRASQGYLPEIGNISGPARLILQIVNKFRFILWNFRSSVASHYCRMKNLIKTNPKK
jgi:hypothetical protein